MPSTAPEPERPVQLRNDVNDLYSLVGQVQTTVRGIADTQRQHGVRLGRLETGVAELRRDVTELQGDVTELRRDVTELRGDVTELRRDVTELRAGQDEIRQEVTSLRAGQDEILELLRARP